MIYTNFDRLSEEKRTLIINAAIKEFVQNGFEKASTNEMVKEAHISKGSLFNYFYSKKDLYIYLIDYGLEVINGFYEDIDLTETDLFKRIENIGIQKLHIQTHYPFAFDLLASALQEEAEEVKEIVKEKVNPIYEQGAELIYQNIDYSKFREDIDIEKAIEILNWTMLGYGDKAIHLLNTFEDMGEFGVEYLKEWQVYSDLLKKSFYK